jgi:hypothetical protein
MAAPMDQIDSARVSASQRLDELVAKDLSTSYESRHQSDPSCRMRLVLRVTECMETLVALTMHDTGPLNPWHRHVIKSVARCRSLVEDSRIRQHHELSVSVMDPEDALTEDTGYFMAVALCDHFMLGIRRSRSDTELAETSSVDGSTDPPHPLESWLGGDARLCFYQGQGPSSTHVYYIWQGTPASALTPVQLDDAFATLFQHARDINWHIWASPGISGLIRALHVRASDLLTAHVYGDNRTGHHRLDVMPEYCGRRALWSCAVARLKLFGLQTLQWRTHQQLRCTDGMYDVTDGPDVGEAPEVATRTALLMAYMVTAVKNWNGPRLRESVSKANTMRLLRPDEVGRNAAFEGSNPYCRARGTTDTVEDALHNVDFVTLLETPEAMCVGVLRLVRDLLMLKLLHNALEAISACDFMGRHVQLQSLRDCRDMSQSSVNLYVHRVWELPGGWVAVPHCPWYPSSGSLSLEAAICLWYDSQFDGNDPLGLHCQ